MTTKHANVWAAFAAAQMEFKTPKQSGTNPHFRSRYSTLDDILSATMPALQKHGLAFAQVGQDGELMSMVIHSETGEKIVSSFPLTFDSNPQKFGSMLTYYKRYAAAALFAVVDMPDDDGEAVVRPPQDTQAPRPPQNTNGAAEASIEAEEIPTGMRKEFHAIGTEVYGNAWNEQRPKLVEAVTAGVETSSKNLTRAEMQKLIDGMRKKRAVQAAQELESVEGPAPSILGQ